jgi:lipopolysaccharide transport system permease protein
LLPVRAALDVLAAPYRLLWHHRRLLLATTRTDIRRKVAGSALGLAWQVLYPLLLLSAYAAVYLYIFKVRFALFDANEYVVLIFCGLIPFLGFAEALASGAVSVTGNAGLIKNTLFPIELIPPKAVLTVQLTQGVSFVLLAAALIGVGKLTPSAPAALLVWCLQCLFTIGLVWMLAAANVFFRDLQQCLSVIVLVLMMVSPIAYTEQMISPTLRQFLKFNPLYYIIMCYQDCLMFGRFPRPQLLLPLTITALLFFSAGYLAFRRLKPLFSDHL